MKNARVAAVSVVCSILQNTDNLDNLVSKTINHLDEKDKKLFHAVVFGVFEKWYELKSIIDKLLKKPLNKKDQLIQATLLCGLFELRWHRSAQYGVVSEYVNVASNSKRPWAKGFINAVLRNFARKKEFVTGSVCNIEAHWNHPRWFVEDLKKAWPEKWKSILVANNTHPPMTIRVNLKKIDRNSYLKLLSNAGIQGNYGQPDSSILLKKPTNIANLPGWDLGYCSIQDSSSQWVAKICAPQKNERVLDACAAPGGKSCHLMEVNEIDLTCVDISSERLKKLSENCTRLSVNPTVIGGDATEPETWWDHRFFDKILIDAPCSGTGVIRRNPDIRRLDSSRIDKLALRQTRLILKLWPLLKKGGQILYTTCSVLEKENDHRVEEALQYIPAEIDNLNVIPGEKTKYGRQILPSHENDGFYFSSLVKTR